MDSLGCEPSTLRRWPWQRRLVGLSRQDDTLLRAYLGQCGSVPDEVHTHVPVGSVPVAEPGPSSDGDRAMLEALWPRRIDCVLRFGRLWRLVEVKPVADHHALGQVLAYAFWWARVPHFPRLDELAVVTWRCDDDCRAVYGHYGIDVIVIEGHGAVTFNGRRFVVVDDTTAEDFLPVGA